MADGEDPAATRRPRQSLRSTLLGLPRLSVMLIAWPVYLFVRDAEHEPYSKFTIRAGLAGDVHRWTAAISPVRSGVLSDAMFADYQFIVAWAIIVVPLCWVAVQGWGPTYRRKTAWRYLPHTALAAALLDVAEDVLIYTYYRHSPGHAALLVLSTVSWLKYVAYLLAVAGVVWCVLGVALQSLVPVRHRDKSEAAAVAEQVDGASGSPPDGFGIALSGGGIRAATVALGALRSFESAPGAPLRAARWLTAVSGGGYTAGGWWVSARGSDASNDPATKWPPEPFFGTESPWANNVETRQRFLANPVGGLAWGVVQALARLVMVLGAILGIGFLLGLGEGWLIRTSALHSRFTFHTGLFPLRVLLPGLTLAALSILVFATTLLVYWLRGPHDRSREPFRVARCLLVVGAVLLAVLVLGPVIVKYVPGALRSIGDLAGANGSNKNTGQGTGIVGVLTGLGVITALTGVLKRTLQRMWLRLGGVLLAVGWSLLVEQVMQRLALGGGSVADQLKSTGWLAVSSAAVAVILLAELVPAHQATLNGIYRKRLAGTFALSSTEVGTVLKPIPEKTEPTWLETAARTMPGPTLIACATAHSAALSRGGVKAHGFTFDPTGVTLFTDDEPHFVPAAAYPSGSFVSGFPERWSITRTMAISGAAFASAMGRQALGTTNALLAATSLRLGAWVPNPIFRDDFTRRPMPRVHLGYLAKEIFGRYHPEHDPFVYVADGGHRENLGLSELLRRRPTLAFAVDASGDKPGTFATLNECISLVRLEQDITIDLNWAPILAPESGLPDDCVTTGTITYTDGRQAKLVYGRYQPCKTCDGSLQAYAKANPPFPYYSTIDQLLDAYQFRMLLQLGEHVGRRMCELAATSVPNYADVLRSGETTDSVTAARPPGPRS